VTPPESAWSSIDNKLKSKTLHDQKIKKKSLKGLLSIAASLAVIFTCFSLIYFGFSYLFIRLAIMAHEKGWAWEPPESLRK